GTDSERGVMPVDHGAPNYSERLTSGCSPSTDCANPSMRPRCRSFKFAHCSGETTEKGHAIGPKPASQLGEPSPVASQYGSTRRKRAARSELAAVSALVFPEMT